MLFRLALAWGLARHTAGLAAVFFAVHPIHVEAVVWAKARPELLALLFMLASALSRSFRFFAVAVSCVWLGAAYQEIFVKYDKWIGLGFLVALVGGFILVKVLAKRVGKAHAKEEAAGAAVPVPVEEPSPAPNDRDDD